MGPGWVSSCSAPSRSASAARWCPRARGGCEGQEPGQAARARARASPPPRAGRPSCCGPSGDPARQQPPPGALRRAARARGGADERPCLALRDDVLVLDAATTVRSTSTRSSSRGGRRATPARLDAYRAALALYGGELLPEDRYEDWTTARREALRETHLGAAPRAGRAAGAGGRHRGARSRRSSGRSSTTRCTRRPTAR